MVVVALILLALIIEMIFRPRFDATRDKKLLLWYGKNNRKYIKIIDF